MEKQIASIFFLLGFNYLMIKSWGTRKVTLLALIGNYFLISILIESYFGLPKFIEEFNALFMLGIGVVCNYIIVFRLVRDVVANHKTTRYAGAATKVIQKNHLA